MVVSPALAAYDPDHMDPSLLTDRLLGQTRHRSVLRDGVIFRAGSPARAVWHLLSGSIGLFRYGRGGEAVAIHQAQAGEYFAEASLHSERYHCTAVALRPSEVVELPAPAMRDLLASDPDFSREWIETLSRQLRQARLRVERLSLRSAQERVRHLLLTEGTGPRHRYVLPTTLKDLAATLGLTHEALYRSLAEMERQGLIRRRTGEISLA